LYSAAWRDYLASPARVHYELWSARWFGGTTALFPGVAALTLAAMALVKGTPARDPRARMALAFGVAGVALSFGPSMPGYAALYHLFLPLQGIRNAARFGYLAIVGCAILASYAVADLRRRCGGSRWIAALSVALVIAANVDGFAGPIEYVRTDTPPRWLAALRTAPAVVAVFPFYSPDRVFRNAPYMLESTRHWRPLLNGYSGLTPDSYVDHARRFARFPDSGAIDALRAAGVTHVIVHDRALRDWTDNETADAVTRAPELQLVREDGDLALYVLKPPR
jgi:hypothetical protein